MSKTSSCGAPGAAFHGDVSRPLPSIAKVPNVGALSARQVRRMQGLERHTGKLVRAVLRGEGGGNAVLLPGTKRDRSREGHWAGTVGQACRGIDSVARVCRSRRTIGGPIWPLMIVPDLGSQPAPARPSPSAIGFLSALGLAAPRYEPPEAREAMGGLQP